MQQRHPPIALEGLPGMPRPAQSYRYVILHLWIITITRRSISLGIAAASLTFVAFQASHHLLTHGSPGAVSACISKRAKEKVSLLLD